jgi:MFS family permease
MSRMGFVLSLSQLVQFLAILCAPLLFRRAGLIKGVVLTQVATAAALASLALVHGASPAVWLYAAYMAAQYMNEPGIYSLLMDQIPADQRSSASASTFFVTSACQAIASVIVGLVIVRFGYSVVLLGIAVVAAGATLLFARLARLEPISSDHLEQAAIYACTGCEENS